MKRLALLTAPLAMVTACSSSSDTIQPGQWEMKMQITDVQVPGAAPAMAEQFATMARGEQIQSQCITPEQAANASEAIGNPTGAARTGCTQSEAVFSGGRIRVVSACPAPTGGGNVRTSLEGSYTPTTIEARFDAEGPAPAAGVPGAPTSIRLIGTMNGRRTGDCTAEKQGG